MADDIRFGQVLRQLLNERFRNRRKDFARSIHVSESALSQYVRGKATPSLHVLVDIARTLDVSLDYLVLGITPEAPAPDYGDLAGHFEEAIARTQAKTATLRDFVGRVGSALAEDVESTARRLLAENEAAVLGIALTETEVRDLERISKTIRIATADLDIDVFTLSGEPDDEVHVGEPADLPRTGQTSFTSVISHNVAHGSEYTYVIPEGPDWRAQARRLRNAVGDSATLSRAAADRRIRFFESSRPLVPGYVMYTVDTALVTTRTERLLDRIKDFVGSDSGLVALAEPPSRQSLHYSLIDPRHHQRMIDDHDAMTRTCPRLVFD
jgi:transcriptional regulator with XRE-family HTH domain